MHDRHSHRTHTLSLASFFAATRELKSYVEQIHAFWRFIWAYTCVHVSAQPERCRMQCNEWENENHRATLLPLEINLKHSRGTWIFHFSWNKIFGMFLTFAIICSSSSRKMSRLSAVRTSALTTVANDNEDSQEAQGLFQMLQMTMTTAQHHVDDGLSLFSM